MARCLDGELKGVPDEILELPKFVNSGGFITSDSTEPTTAPRMRNLTIIGSSLKSGEQSSISSMSIDELIEKRV